MERGRKSCIKRWAALAVVAALVLTGCSFGGIGGGGGSAAQKIDRPAVESAELQFTHPAAGDTIAVFDTSAGVFKAVLFPDEAPQATIISPVLCRQVITMG